MYLEAGTLLNGRYRIEEKIGVGGMAIVYRGEDIRLGRSVTVKVLKEEYTGDAEFKERFQIEARAVAKLTHPNIVNVYDVCEDGDIYYIVMEYIEGDTLKVLIDAHAPFQNKLVLTVGLNIAQALSHAHKHHIVHRDIKPQNILISVDGSVKVTDFGIARAAAGSTLSTTANALGSVHYFSPEQARGGYIDEKSDIYSLGVTMYEMATGRVPFDGDTSVAVALKHLNEELPPIEKYNPEVAHSVAGIIRKATRKKADERYANIDVMIADLKRALAEESGETPPPVEEMEADKPPLEFFVPEKRSGHQQEPPYEEEAPRREHREEPRSVRQKQPTDQKRPQPKRKQEPPEEADTAERKVVIAAVITALVIIAAIVFVFSKVMGDKSPISGLFQPNMVPAPTLVGSTLEDAQAKAKELGVEVEKETEAYSTETAAGLISEQSIAAGTEIEEGTVIRVTISKGLETFSMPKLTDISENDAVKQIQDLVSTTPDLTYEYNDEVPATIVIAQDPAEGAEIDAETEITLTVSRGAELATMVVPNVVGNTEAEAKKMLEEAGFTLGRVTKVSSDTVAEGRVITQTVAANSIAIAKTAIGLAVSSGPKQQETPPAEVTPQTPQTPQTPSTPAETTPPSTITPEEPTTQPTTPDNTTTGKTVNFTVSAPAMGGDFGDTVYVQLIQIKEDGSSSIVLDTEKNIGDFPFSVTLTGSGKEAVQLFIDGSYQWSETVNFE